MTDDICIADDCRKKSRIREFCEYHYYRALRVGEIKKVIKPQSCAVTACGKEVHCKELCRSHYNQKSRAGTTTYDPATVAKPDIRPMVAASVRRASIKETRRQRLANRGIVPCAY